MVGSLLFAGLIGTLYTESPLAEAISRGTGLVEKNVDHTVEISEPEQLSDLAMFTYQRASRLGCSENEGGLADFEGGNVHLQNQGEINSSKNGNPEQQGYPGLQDSYLGRYPDCYGAEDRNFKGIGGASPTESGEDMEGIYSREKFEIKNIVVLEAGDSQEAMAEEGGLETGDGGGTTVERDQGTTWLEKNFIVASKSNFEQQATKCSKLGGKFRGTRQQFTMYFQPEPSEERALPWMEDENQGIGDSGPYCKGTDDRNLEIAKFMGGRGEIDEPSKVVLCPGDKGYIQMNKWTNGDPTNTGEVGTVIGLGYAYKAGFIQITELGENCGSAVPQIPEDENGVGNIYSIEANVNKGWTSVTASDLHRTRDEGKKFHTVSPYNFDPLEQDQCGLYLRDKDGIAGDDTTGKNDNGAVVYKQGTLIGHKNSDTFPNLDSESIVNADLEEGNFNTGVSTEKDTRHMYYIGENSLENVGFTGEQVNSEIPFLRSDGDNTFFQSYGDMLCTKAETDDYERSSNARWVVCDERNYEGRTTVEVEHYNGDREYRCSPGSGDWDLVSTSSGGGASEGSSQFPAID